MNGEPGFQTDGGSPDRIIEALERVESERVAANNVAKELAAYVRHKPDCVVGMAAGALSEACDCGLRDLLTRAFPDEAKTDG